MIELIDIKKTYKSKKGLSTDALKGINIKFQEKGLTFILGKSGSGKSTLLNILGGLDTYTSGDIIVNGKSTKKFKESEWDAYRNTYMGFVFQEFNLLDNYNIEDNIKLAMELQHKKCNSKDVLNALEMVDLGDIRKRKTNELSGGQKQRVAIARALIKNPEIILADEPTGNLDSETSKQIFEILKKLSKEKLVVVVSHDEESAKKYADRIIRISDGLIISDNVDKVEDNKQEFKLVNAKLPLFYSLKMGLGNLFHKKLRCVFTALMIILCLICFGLSLSPLSIDINEEYSKYIEENGSMEIWLEKYDSVYNSEKIFKETFKSIFSLNLDYINSLYPDEEDITDEDLKSIENNTNLNWYTSYYINNDGENIYWQFVNSSKEKDPIYYYYNANIFVVEYDDSILNSYNLIGNVPTNDDEIMINSYIADLIIYKGIYSKANKDDENFQIYNPTSYEQIVNDDIYINFGDMSYVKVVGILDTSDYLSKYDELKKKKASSYIYTFSTDEDSIMNEFNGDLSLYTIYVSNSFIEKLENIEINTNSDTTTRILYDDTSYSIYEFGYILNELEVIKDDGISNISNLNDDEVIINTILLDEITSGDFTNKLLESNCYNINDFIVNYIKDNNIIGKTLRSPIDNNKVSKKYKEYKIVGVVNDDLDYSFIYYSKNIIKDLMPKVLEVNRVYTTVSTKEELMSILEYYPIDNSNILSLSEYSSILLGSKDTSSIVKVIGKYGTIFFLVFSIIILMNFISTSIRFRKKEIGILRAIGCRSIDVMQMFIYECLTLMFVCLIISFMFVPDIVNSINVSMSDYIEIDILSFGYYQMLGITLVMLLIAIIASIIPLRRLTKMKPIDTILDK